MLFTFVATLFLLLLASLTNAAPAVSRVQPNYLPAVAQVDNSAPVQPASLLGRSVIYVGSELVARAPEHPPTDPTDVRAAAGILPLRRAERFQLRVAREQGAVSDRG